MKKFGEINKTKIWVEEQIAETRKLLTDMYDPQIFELINEQKRIRELFSIPELIGAGRQF